MTCWRTVMRTRCQPVLNDCHVMRSPLYSAQGVSSWGACLQEDSAHRIASRTALADVEPCPPHGAQAGGPARQCAFSCGAPGGAGRGCLSTRSRWLLPSGAASSERSACLSFSCETPHPGACWLAPSPALGRPTATPPAWGCAPRSGLVPAWGRMILRKLQLIALIHNGNMYARRLLSCADRVWGGGECSG